VFLEKTALPLLVTLNQMIIDLNLEGDAIYLPPEALKDPESSKVLLTKNEKTKLTTPKQAQDSEKPFGTKTEGILIKPPGADLVKLFEITLNTKFIKVDLKYLERNIYNLFVNELEIAENVQIQVKENIVSTEIKNSIYAKLHTETEELPKVTTLLGCPICSAIACAITKASGKPLIIEKHQTSKDGRTITTEYRLL
jgi:hypothetical protein